MKRTLVSLEQAFSGFRPSAQARPNRVGTKKPARDTLGGIPTRRENGRDQWKLSPQAQLPAAFGLSIVKPCSEIVSLKSIFAPSR